MLQFLNNQQNRKDSPNENFAREVMELFTLGRGEYTEQDIKNAARAKRKEVVLDIEAQQMGCRVILSRVFISKIEPGTTM